MVNVLYTNELFDVQSRLAGSRRQSGERRRVTGGRTYSQSEDDTGREGQESCQHLQLQILQSPIIQMQEDAERRRERELINLLRSLSGG